MDLKLLPLVPEEPMVSEEMVSEEIDMLISFVYKLLTHMADNIPQRP